MLLHKILIAPGCWILIVDALALVDDWRLPPTFPAPTVVMASPVGAARAIDVQVVPQRGAIWWQDTRARASTHPVRLASPLSVDDGLLLVNVVVLFVMLVGDRPWRRASAGRCAAAAPPCSTCVRPSGTRRDPDATGVFTSKRSPRRPVARRALFPCAPARRSGGTAGRHPGAGCSRSAPSIMRMSQGAYPGTDIQDWGHPHAPPCQPAAILTSQHVRMTVANTGVGAGTPSAQRLRRKRVTGLRRSRAP